MSLMRPTATITLDGTTLSSAEAGLARLRLDLGFNTHDRAQLILWPRSKLASAGPGSDINIALGTGSGGAGLGAGIASGGTGDETVWTGLVQSVQTSAGCLILTGLADTIKLSRTRRSTTWSDQTVGDIVSDLAAEVSNEVDAELELPNFSIDNNRSIWSYLHELATLSGAELSCSAEGGVRFILSTKETASTDLHFGSDLIDWRLSLRQELDVVAASEHGAASSAGNDKWHWLAHDPVGENGEAMLIPAAFRTRTAAEKFTEAANARIQRATVRGEVWIHGRPPLRPGNIVELKGIPEGDSGPLRVRSVTHQLDGDNGFITALSVEGGGGAGGLL